MRSVSPEFIVSAVQGATSDVFRTMLGLPAKAGPAREEDVAAAGFDGIVALVGIGGPWTGTGRISCSPQLSCRLAGVLLMSHYEYVNEDVLDAVAEVANMIIGGVKTTLEERLGPLALSIPTVVFGRNYQTRCAGVRHWTVIPFQCGDEVLEVRFCLVQSPVQKPVTQRPEQVCV
jgi:chemotaxis protein CheX